MLRGRNCDDWVRKLNALMFIDVGMAEGVFDINTDNRIALVKL